MFKAFTAILILPETELPAVVDTMEWVSNPDHDCDDYLFAGSCCQVYSAPFLGDLFGVSLCDASRPRPRYRTCSTSSAMAGSWFRSPCRYVCRIRTSTAATCIGPSACSPGVTGRISRRPVVQCCRWPYPGVILVGTPASLDRLLRVIPRGDGGESTPALHRRTNPSHED